MLIRIVRMSFEPSKINNFLDVFNESKDKIASFEGCNSVELLRDFDQENVFYTYSVWEGKEYLEKYRHSDLFKSVWARTKIHFNDKPMAYSLKKN